MARIDINLKYCKGCGLCVDVCPKQVIEIDDQTLSTKGIHPAHQVDPDNCIGCANCAALCPDAAITVWRQ